jgi:organic radical activating enzyme
MFGQNPIRAVERNAAQLAVEDIFYTIQGEGPFAGCPALFIRLAGCNLACHFCDTQFETMADMPGDTAELLGTILNVYPASQRKLVVITGGEPMRQNFSALAAGLLAAGTETIQIETAGTVWQPDLADMIKGGSIVLVCSPKTPRVHANIVEYCDHWKYIIRGGEVGTDGLPNVSTQKKGVPQILYRPWQNRALTTAETIWLSPCDDYDAVLNKVNQDLARDLCLKHGYRLSLQMHKLVDVK